MSSTPTLMRFAVMAFLLSGFVEARDLGRTINALLDGSAVARQAFWGIRVVDLRSGAVLYRRNDEKLFEPASNTKLFTTSLGLVRLGKNYRFRTIVTADGKPTAEGVVSGMRLVGGGDPNLSARVLPYQMTAPGQDPLLAIKQLGDDLVAAGVREVAGDVTGDDTAYEWEPYPEGWPVSDPVYEYGAPVSALTLNDNAISLTVTPGELAGEPATISLSPPLEHLVIHNFVETRAGTGAKLTYERIPGSNELYVRGTIGTTHAPMTESVAVNDPALFAAEALRTELLRRGVRVSGKAVAGHRLLGERGVSSPGMELASHTSAALSESVVVINKVSQNLHAELLLREVAKSKNGYGSQAGGLAELETFLAEAGIHPEDYHFEDGSGLSRLTLVTPRAVTALLSFMHSRPEKESFMKSLPVGGVDGSLADRFGGSASAHRILAKTGSLTHVRALSGYVQQPSRTLAFCIFVNNYNNGSAEIRRLIDSVAMAIQATR